MNGISGAAASAERQAAAPRLPMAALLALTMCSFIATANETVAAGLLPQIARGFGVSQGWAGQWVTACALGSGLAAMPLTIALHAWQRRLALLLSVAGFIVGNAVTALSPYFELALAAAGDSPSLRPAADRLPNAAASTNKRISPNRSVAISNPYLKVIQ